MLVVMHFGHVLGMEDSNEHRDGIFGEFIAAVREEGVEVETFLKSGIYPYRRAPSGRRG